MSSGDDLPPVDEITDLVARATAIWRARLADLGGRNTLLWHRELPTGSLDLTVAHPSGEAKLLAGHRTRLSELVRAEQSFREALRRVLAIRAKIQEVERERGPAVGFAAIGMASWRIPGAPTAPWAPVMVRTCEIEPTDAGYGDAFLSLGPDLVFNPVLAHYLRHEHGLDIDDYAVLAPARLGQGGFDPRPTYAALEEVCAGIPGFKLGPQRVISTFPWSKMAMVGDLTSVHLTLDEHPIALALARHAVRSAARADQQVPGPESDDAEHTAPVGPGDDEGADAETARDQAPEPEAGAPHDVDLSDDPEPTPEPAPEEAGASDAPDPEPVRDPAAEFVVLDADAGQSAAIAAVRRGESIVLDAAPGTGRTQVLASLVAMTLGAEDRPGTVLLTSQRAGSRAAVRRRLAHLGLDHLVLELREDITGSRLLADAILRALDAAEDPRLPEPGPDPVQEWTRALESLRLDHEALHRTRQPWDVTVAEGQARIARLATGEHPPTSRVHLDEATLLALDADSVALHADALRRAVREGAWPASGEDPWYGARLTTEEEVERARDIVDRLAGGEFSAAREAMEAVSTEAGLPVPTTLAQWAEQLDLMGRVRDTLEVFRSDVYAAPLPQMREATRDKSSTGDDDRPGLVSRARLRRQARHLLRPGPRPRDLGAAVAAAADEQAQWVRIAGGGGRPGAPTGLEDAAQAFGGIELDLRWLARVLGHTEHLGADVTAEPLDTLLQRLRRLDAHPDRLAVTRPVWELLQPLRDAGLGAVVDDVAGRRLPEPAVAAEVEFVFWSSLLRHLAESDPVYGGHDGDGLRSHVRAFISADRRHVQAGVDAVTLAAGRRMRRAANAHPGEVAALRELAAEPTHTTYAEALAVAPHVLPALFPVLSVSPLVVAATVPPQVRADLVIVDDAESLDVAPAVSTLARGRQVVLAGQAPAEPDAAAVPPPSGYLSTVDERAERLLALNPPRLEPLLGTVLTEAGLTRHRLRAHHRGGDQRLLARDGARPPRSLPTPGTRPVAEHAVVTGGADARARHVAERVLRHARTSPEHSLAVLTTDQASADEVDAAVRAAVRENPDLATSFRENAVEPFVVRPIERASGVVRDVVILGLGEGDRADLGVLADGAGEAWARLVRAGIRHRLVVVSGRPEGEWEGDGAADLLRDALDTGSAPVPTTTTTDPLLAGLAARLREEGLVVHEHYGVGEDTVDLAIEHPHRRGTPLVAVLTDADPALVVSRDSLRLRREQLVRLGWWPVTVFSVDLFRDPARDVAMIQRVVQEAAASTGRASL